MCAELFRHSVLIGFLYIFICCIMAVEKKKKKIAHLNEIKFRASNMTGHRRHVHI